jgi:hypothetical protein
MKLKKKRLCFVSFLIGIFFLLSFASATDQPTYVYSKMFLNPFYTGSTTLNTNTTFTLGVFPPEQINQVVSAIITFDVWMTPSVNFTLWVNNQTCRNPFYYISTTYAGAGKSQIYFDCSNVIDKAGNYQIKLRATKDTGALTGWIDLTYSNRPKGEMKVFGTEYTYGQVAKIWLQLTNGTGQTIENGVCYADIYAPDGSTFLERATMTNMVHDGIYYYDLEVPIGQGVYPVVAFCYYEAGQSYRNVSNYSIGSGTYDSGAISDMAILDGNFIRFKETAVNPVRNISVNITTNGGALCNISEALLTGISVSTYSRFDSVANDHITLFIWNYTSSSWITFPNQILEGASWKSVTNSIPLNNLTKAGLVNASGSNIILKFNDTILVDGATSNLDIDYLQVSCDQLSNPQWQEVRGSSEIHVSSDLAYELDFQNNSFSINDTQVIPLANGTNITYNYYTGVFKNDFTLAGGVTSSDVLVEYQELHSIPCNAILGLFYKNSTGYYPYPYFTQRQTEEDHCSVNFLVDFTAGENFEFEVYARNFWENDMRSSNTAVGSIYPLLNSGCLLWQILKGYPPYVIPKNQSNEAYDYYYRACGNFHDAYYWFNYSYNQALQDKSLIVDDLTYVQYESDYISTQSTQDMLYLVTTSLLNNLQTISDYSKLILDNPLGNLTNMSDQMIWANYSTIMQNYRILNNSCGTGICTTNFSAPSEINYSQMADYVWNATDRNLTYTADATNYSLISSSVASSVWNWMGNVSSNILNSFSVALIQPIASAVWSFTDRNLTYYEDVANYSKIAEYVWMYENRNLTFYEVNNISVDEIWNYMDRNLTFYPETNYTAVADYVWNYVDRNLTFEQISNLTAEDIWTYYNRSLTDDIPLQIWSYPNRNLTTDIPFDIWNYENRTLTYYTINLTELIEMVQEYEFNQTPIPFDEGGITFSNAQLNVTLYVIK